MRLSLCLWLLLCIPCLAQEQQKDVDQLFQDLVLHLDAAQNIRVIAVFEQSLRVQLSYEADGDRIDAQLDFHTVLPPAWAKRQDHYEVNVPFVGMKPNRARLQFKDRTQSVMCYRTIRDLAASFGSVDPNAVEPAIKQ